MQGPPTNRFDETQSSTFSDCIVRLMNLQMQYTKSLRICDNVLDVCVVTEIAPLKLSVYNGPMTSGPKQTTRLVYRRFMNAY